MNRTQISDLKALAHEITIVVKTEPRDPFIAILDVWIGVWLLATPHREKPLTALALGAKYPFGLFGWGVFFAAIGVVGVLSWALAKIEKFRLARKLALVPQVAGLWTLVAWSVMFALSSLFTSHSSLILAGVALYLGYRHRVFAIE